MEKIVVRCVSQLTFMAEKVPVAAPGSRSVEALGPVLPRSSSPAHIAFRATCSKQLWSAELRGAVETQTPAINIRTARLEAQFERSELQINALTQERAQAPRIWAPRARPRRSSTARGRRVRAAAGAMFA